MPCGVCQKAAQANRFKTSNTYTAPASTQGCDFTLEMLQVYKEKLKCIKDNALYETLNITEAKVNSYLGIVISSINYKSNYCRFEKELINIRDLIFTMVNQGIC